MIIALRMTVNQVIFVNINDFLTSFEKGLTFPQKMNKIQTRKSKGAVRYLRRFFCFQISALGNQIILNGTRVCISANWRQKYAPFSSETPVQPRTDGSAGKKKEGMSLCIHQLT